MSYIGKEPQYTDFLSKFFSGDGTAMTVTLDASPPNEAALLVFIDGVRQDTSAYTVSGYSLTFTGTVPSGTNNVQVLHLGLTQDVGVPSDDTISTAKIQDNAITTVKIQDDAVTSAKLANSLNITSGNSLTIDSGATITNNGSALGFADAVVAFDAVKSGSSTSISKATWTKIPLDTVNVDTDSAFASNKFTVPSGKGGKYFLSGQFQGNEVAGYVTGCNVSIYVNGASVADSAFNFYNNNIIDQKQTTVITCRVIELADGDYVELYGYVNTNGTTPIYYGALTRLSGHRLGD